MENENEQHTGVTLSGEPNPQDGAESPAPREDYDRREGFDEEVSPLIDGLVEKCKELGIPVVVSGCVSATREEDGSRYSLLGTASLGDKPLEETRNGDDHTTVRGLLDDYPHPLVLALAGSMGLPSPEAIKDSPALFSAVLSLMVKSAMEAGETEAIDRAVMPYVMDQIANGPFSGLLSGDETPDTDGGEGENKEG